MQIAASGLLQPIIQAVNRSQNLKERIGARFLAMPFMDAKQATCGGLS